MEGGRRVAKGRTNMTLKKKEGGMDGSEGVADEIRVERRRGMHTAGGKEGGREGGRDNERE